MRLARYLSSKSIIRGRPPRGESVSLGSAATEAYVMAANPKNQNARIVSLAVIAPHPTDRKFDSVPSSTDGPGGEGLFQGF